MSEVLIFRENLTTVEMFMQSSLEERASCRSYSLQPGSYMRREVNKGFVEVNGARVNRGAGLWPGTYSLYGPKVWQTKTTFIKMQVSFDLVITYFLCYFNQNVWGVVSCP